MTAQAAPSPEDAALATWLDDLDAITGDLRTELGKAAADRTLTRARRTALVADHVWAVSEAGARFLEATARDPYPPGKARRREQSA